jgi:puromycin-sensitive aminopeptidase
MCGGIVGLATPELEQEVHGFFTSRKIDLGGKTLEQYLEQLRIAVRMLQEHRLMSRTVSFRYDVGLYDGCVTLELIPREV